MKLISMFLVVMFCFIVTASAEMIDISDTINKVPVEEIKEGVLYSFDDKKLKPATSYGLVGNLFGVRDLSLDIGSILEDDEALVSLSYNLLNLRKDLDITAWVLDLVEISITAGYGVKRIGGDNEGDPLIGLGLIKFKF